MIHDLPICFGCTKDVSHDPIFAAPCNHDRCPSVVWHPLCLMEFRENRERQDQDLGRFLDQHRIVGLIGVPKEDE